VVGHSRIPNDPTNFFRVNQNIKPMI